jgi:hypothetical protein
MLPMDSRPVGMLVLNLAVAIVAIWLLRALRAGEPAPVMGAV